MPKKFVIRHEVIQPLDTSYRLIPLTQGQNTIVDATDYDWLNQWNWFAHLDRKTGNFYAVRNSHPITQISMAREILQLKAGEEVDHQNHDTLNNCRKNIRKATRQQNGSNRKIPSNNTSGYKGVTWEKNIKKWQAYITHNKKRINLGYFTSAKEAALMRDETAKKLLGEFAVLNLT